MNGPNESKRDWERMAEGWKKWHAKFSRQSSEATKAILDLAQVKEGMTVLDLACGSGEPSLSIARAVGPRGRVVATDIAPGMLKIAETNARDEGLSNIEFKPANAEAIPFPDGSYDAVTCRFGLMFFPNPEKAMGEIRRVLKIGGVVALVTWGPIEKNPRFTTTAAIVEKYRRMSKVEERASDADVFRFAEIGSMTKILSEARFGEISEKQIIVPWIWDGSVEEQFKSFSEMSAPFRKLYSEVNRGCQQKITAEILAAMGEYYDGRRVNFTAVINTAAAKKIVK